MCLTFMFKVQNCCMVQQSDFTLKLKQEHMSKWATECTGN